MEPQRATDQADSQAEGRPTSRIETQRLRRKPGEAAHLVATFDRGDAVMTQEKPGPIEISLQATNTVGELAPWLDDLWWTDAITRWGNDSVTVRVAPTSHALLHPVLLYQLHMLRRVVPHWRLIGHAYADDFLSREQLREIALSPYHELRFIDQCRPGNVPAEANSPSPLSETLRLIRAEQQSLGVTLPVLARLAPGHA